MVLNIGAARSVPGSGKGAMESYRVAGIDVHKKMLAVVVAEAADGGEYRFERATPGPASARSCAS